VGHCTSCCCCCCCCSCSCAAASQVPCLLLLLLVLLLVAPLLGVEQSIHDDVLQCRLLGLTDVEEVTVTTWITTDTNSTQQLHDPACI